MGVTRYYLPFSRYEQLKLPFLTNLTEGVVSIGQLTKANFSLYLTEIQERTTTTQGKLFKNETRLKYL